MSNPEKRPEPLPIWFFVGVILLVYGVLVVVGGLSGPSDTVLAETRPSLWWGGILCGAGAIFTLIGIKVHRDTSRGEP
jgi:hypothetical protein